MVLPRIHRIFLLYEGLAPQAEPDGGVRRGTGVPPHFCDNEAIGCAYEISDRCDYRLHVAVPVRAA